MTTEPKLLDMHQADAIWREYLRTHDRSEYAGNAVGIDLETGEILFAPSVAHWSGRPNVVALVVGRTDRLRRRVR